MKCPNCGADNAPGKIVCRNCGRRLRPGPQTGGPVAHSEEELMTRLRGDVRRLIVVIAVVIASGIALGFVIR